MDTPPMDTGLATYRVWFKYAKLGRDRGMPVQSQLLCDRYPQQPKTLQAFVAKIIAHGGIVATIDRAESFIPYHAITQIDRVPENRE